MSTDRGGAEATDGSASRPSLQSADARIRSGPVSDSQAVERRRRVLRIASDLFLERGYSGTSIDEIARRSRVSKATLYREYGTKEDMFREFYTSSIQPFAADLRDAIDRRRDFDDVVRRIVRDLLRRNFDKPTMGLLRLAIAERDRFPSIAALVLQYGRMAMRPLSDYFRDVAGRDSMSEAEADRYSQHLVNMALGGSAVLLTDPQLYYGDRDAWVDSVTQVFLAGFPMASKARPPG